MKQCFRFQLHLLICMLLISLAGYSQNKASNVTPIPMPKLQSTGNVEVDRANHAKALQMWKEQESKRVDQLRSNSIDPKNTTAKSKVAKTKSNTPSSSVKSNTVSKDDRIRETTIINLPGYPKYISTGNPSLDEKNYQNAKAEWINANPAEYSKYVSDHSGHSGKLKRNTPKPTN